MWLILVLAGVVIRASSIQIRRNPATELLVGTFAGTASMVASRQMAISS